VLLDHLNGWFVRSFIHSQPMAHRRLCSGHLNCSSSLSNAHPVCRSAYSI
jgi:hypothetical protein